MIGVKLSSACRGCCRGSRPPGFAERQGQCFAELLVFGLKALDALGCGLEAA